jgi:hypothetical protein
MRRAPLIAVATLAILAVSSMPSRAAELVTLTNGFVQRCNHHAQVQGRVRLYLSPGEDNYIEFPPAEVASFETVPDPPPSEPAASPAAPAASSPAHLTPADLHEMLTQAGTAHNIDVDLLASVVKAESGGNARAVSRTGAQGLMQLMPGTASDLGVKDSFEPGQNVRGGSAYLDALLTRYHDNLSLALAAYNAGPAAVDKYHGIPPYSETQAYVARVIHEFNRRVIARTSTPRSPAPQSAQK